ncbi:hypothetical protein MTR67_044773 [Solanum verrucosum]|uniref:SWIM-type domain-containing protein n=1 Tax=Solanum verrucosum TaxID=315347 RepID=A0AAF0UU37_SOLVR|nr:hypothetical protein MTR67_044773 [Solanum verrucosum]
MIRKKLKLHVGKTIVRRARAKVLKDIMGDHVVEFGRILDYKDELLRTNPGTSCVVKVGEPDAEGKSIFQSFYICFDALKKTWIHCMKCIGLDGCFLKGVCKGQLLVVVARDDNNQMLPLAWAVVEKENKHTWTMFVKCIKDDLGLGDGEGLTLITDMQKVLEENISRSIDCTIEFNGAVGFEVKEGLCQHKVDIARRTCSCRVWQLRGIPCAHLVAALYFKKFSLYDYIDSCYSKETYLRIYANVIEPLTNMEMLPVSTNPTIEPPEITNMPGRPPKARRKEAEETKKSGKLPRTGLAMTCSICHVKGHNKRGCPQREGVESSTRQSAPSPTSVRAEQQKTPSAPLEGEPPLIKGRGRPKKTSLVAPSALPLPTAPTDVPASSSTPPTYHASSSIAGTTKRGRGRGRGNTSPEKRPRVMGMGVFQAANGFKVMNIYSTGQAKVTRSSDVTGDIGYTPSNTTKLKWNGKAANSTSKLHELREKQGKKTMGSSSSQNDTSSQSKMPWKL